LPLAARVSVRKIYARPSEEYEIRSSVAQW
jgi:hypothetical protein